MEERGGPFRVDLKSSDDGTEPLNPQALRHVGRPCPEGKLRGGKPVRLRAIPGEHLHSEAQETGKVRD